MPASSFVLKAVVAWMLCLGWCGDVAVVLADGEDPANPVCRYIAKDSLPFCSMVDYVAVVDADDPNGARFDSKAEFYYRNVDVVLQRFGCHAKYSVYGCDDCREAYKYWICSIKFQKCGSQTVTTGQGASELQYHPALCDSTSEAASASSSAADSSASSPGGSGVAASCVEGSTGRYRTCLSICEDVVRKCPFVLNFQCPAVSWRSSHRGFVLPSLSDVVSLPGFPL
ncbi:hypothetical protein BBJ28_00017423 [Nothophytophthora sp. Chile5]|nr:hypothetical protein BBJ28_00017423 [Nothophytophthora sp. Chile5]